MKKKFYLQYTVPFLSCLCFVPVFGYNAAFFSFVQSGSPTERDTISIVSAGYFQSNGLVTDSSFSLSGNQFRISYTVKQNTLFIDRLNHTRKIGKLAAGNYTIITSTLYLSTSDQNLPDTEQFIDTATFRVTNANTPNPIITGSYSESNSYSVPGDNSLSYYYFNGDTLSVAVAFPLNSMPPGFLISSSLHSDTIDFIIIDTTLFQASMPMPYVVTGSIAPVKPAKYFLRVQYQRQSCINPFKLPNFHSNIIDCTREGLAFSIKKAGSVDFTFFPVDTEINDYSYLIYSPFLDTFRVLSFQPNPLCKIPQHPNILIGAMTADWTQVADWESYNKNDWHYEQVQQSDIFHFDTLTIDYSRKLKITYSNISGQAVKSYIYRNLDSIIVINNPAIRLSASFVSTENSAINNRRGHAWNSTLSPLQIKYSSSYILISILRPAFSLTGGNIERMHFNVTDLQGRIIRTVESIPVESNSQWITAVWDECNAAGNRVPAGTYLISMGLKRAVAIVSH
jgi:hypothetical protein